VSSHHRRRRSHHGGGEPVWARPAPGARRPRYTRERIAAAALAIADAEGIEAVSMRRVAAALGAGTMTLYHYVPTKHDLLALMDDSLMAELLVSDDELAAGWREALTRIAKRSRAAWLRHPWAISFLRGARIGPNGMRHFEQSMTAVAGLPLSFERKVELISLVDDYVLGSALRGDVDEVIDDAWASSVAGYIESQLATGEFPHIVELLGDDDVETGLRRLAAASRAEDRFERGLAAIFDSVARDLDVG
jgi:AcrR family transcriptional regulator